MMLLILPVARFVEELTLYLDRDQRHGFVHIYNYLVDRRKHKHFKDSTSSLPLVLSVFPVIVARSIGVFSA